MKTARSWADVGHASQRNKKPDAAAVAEMRKRYTDAYNLYHSTGDEGDYLRMRDLKEQLEEMQK